MKISKKTGKGKCLYCADRKKLYNYLLNNISLINAGILFSLLLGLRQAEVCGIRWKDIDLKSNVLYIRNIISRVKDDNNENKAKLIITSPKTENSKRTLPLPNKILNILKEYKSDKDNYLLTNSKSFMDPRTFYNHYRRVIKKIRIKYTYHDLRHTFATNCIDLGIDYKTLMELLGHSNVTTTLNIYVHPTIANKRKYINKLLK